MTISETTKANDTPTQPEPLAAPEKKENEEEGTLSWCCRSLLLLVG